MDAYLSVTHLEDPWWQQCHSFYDDCIVLVGSMEIYIGTYQAVSNNTDVQMINQALYFGILAFYFITHIGASVPNWIVQIAVSRTLQKRHLKNTHQPVRSTFFGRRSSDSLDTMYFFLKCNKDVSLKFYSTPGCSSLPGIFELHLFNYMYLCVCLGVSMSTVCMEEPSDVKRCRISCTQRYRWL